MYVPRCSKTMQFQLCDIAAIWSSDQALRMKSPSGKQADHTHTVVFHQPPPFSNTTYLENIVEGEGFALVIRNESVFY